MSERVWLITGAARGFGRSIAAAARAAGDTVVVTARDPESIADSDGALVLDVTDPASIHAAVEATIARHGRIDVLVNNAGHGLVGAVEELTADDLLGLLDVNLLGAFRLTTEVVGHMRSQGGGHIVQMSSVGGVVANPGHAAYATTKFALEGLSEALAAEVAPFGIRVTIVEPGPFRTEFAGRSIRYAAANPAYADTPAGILRARFAEQDGVQPNDPDRAAALIVEAVADPASPLRLPLGPEAIDRIRTKLRGQLADLDAWAPIGRNTRYLDR
ncbi:oxidoreductase [Gordonia sinesedis]